MLGAETGTRTRDLLITNEFLILFLFTENQTIIPLSENLATNASTNIFYLLFNIIMQIYMFYTKTVRKKGS